jgi:hypothetical protein
MPTAAKNDDLLWLAFRYVAGELDVDESEAFEHRLSQDQAAREAVAEAVGLVQAVALGHSPAHTSLPIRRPRRTAMIGVAAGLAACLALVVVWPLVSRWAAVPAGWNFGGSQTHGPGADVAATWAGIADREDDPPMDVLASLDDQGGLADAGPGSSLDAGVQDDATPPPWLLEAASLRGDGRTGRGVTKEN